MNIILHIGTEKTGTTSIQNALRQNADDLLGQGFVTYPGVAGNFNNLELVLASCPEPGADLVRFREGSFQDFLLKAKDDIGRIIYDSREKNRDVIFSSEHMSSRLHREEYIKNLHDIFPKDIAFKIVVYLKPQYSLYSGSVAEALKAGIAFEKITRPENILNQERYGSEYYNYYNLLKKWEGVFGKENIIVKKYTYKDLLNNDSVDDFFSTLGVEFENRGANINSNVSLSPECLLLISRLMETCGIKDRAKAIEILQKVDPYKKGEFFSKEVLSNFYFQFQESNRIVAEKYFNSHQLFDEGLSYSRFLDINNTEHLDNAFKEILSLAAQG